MFVSKIHELRYLFSGILSNDCNNKLTLRTLILNGFIPKNGSNSKGLVKNKSKKYP
jgi:hypothetical protein